MPKSNAGLSHGVWGLRISQRIQAKWRSLAVLVNVPVSWLIEYVLEEWLADNTEVFGESGRGKFRKAIVESHQGDDNPAAPFGISNEDLANLRTNLSIRNVGMETRLKLKIMAASEGTTMNRLLDDMTRAKWQTMEKKPAASGMAAKTRRELKKLFERQVR